MCEVLVADTSSADDAPTDMNPCEKSKPWIGTTGGDVAPGWRRGAGLLLGGVPAAAATLSQGADDAQLVVGGRATAGLTLTARPVGGVPSTLPWSGEGARGGCPERIFAERLTKEQG